MDIEAEIKGIHERNKRVEAEKAWETSLFRTGLVCVLTYVLTAVVFYIIGVRDYLLNALIPSLGFFLSTQSLPWVKKWWIDKRLK